MDPQYQPKSLEPAVQKEWADTKAFVEAYAGIRNGSISQDLQFAKGNIYRQEQEAQYLGLNFGEIYSDFD